MANSESGSPSSYSRFIVTICLSSLVSEIFACETDRQTDGRTTRTITIAGSHIVAGPANNLRAWQINNWNWQTMSAVCRMLHNDRPRPSDWQFRVSRGQVELSAVWQQTVRLQHCEYIYQWIPYVISRRIEWPPGPAARTDDPWIVPYLLQRSAGQLFAPTGGAIFEFFGFI